MTKDLTDSQVDVILDYCREEVKRSFVESEKERKRHLTEEDIRSDGASRRLNGLFYDTGYRNGIRFVIEILETRKLP